MFFYTPGMHHSLLIQAVNQMESNFNGWCLYREQCFWVVTMASKILTKQAAIQYRVESLTYIIQLLETFYPDSKIDYGYFFPRLQTVPLPTTKRSRTKLQLIFKTLLHRMFPKKITILWRSVKNIQTTDENSTESSAILSVKFSKSDDCLYIS